MHLAEECFRLAGIGLVLAATSAFLACGIANLYRDDEACRPNDDAPPPPPPAPPPAPASNPDDVTAPEWLHQGRPDLQTTAPTLPPLSTRRQAPPYVPAGAWWNYDHCLGTTTCRPCWLHRFLWRTLFGVRWLPYPTQK